MSSFLEACIDRYPNRINFNVEEKNIEATTSSNYANSRKKMFGDLIERKTSSVEYPRALFLEHVVFTALSKNISEKNLDLYCAPQSLELSNKFQKGVDLLICDKEKEPLLGIDVKLRKGKSFLNRDGYGWQSTLKCPYIYLSLGNFSVDTREGKNKKIRDWLSECALDKISNSGKIPKLNEFKKYLSERIKNSLTGIIERISDQNDYLFFPYLSEDELKIVEKKTLRVLELFT